MDILNTPSLSKPKKDYFRTPGQIISLITSLGFVSVVTNYISLVYVTLSFFVQYESCDLSLSKHRIHQQTGKANDTAVHL